MQSEKLILADVIVVTCCYYSSSFKWNLCVKFAFV